MTSTKIFRKEKKFVIKENNILSFENWLRTMSKATCKYPMRNINSIYFDDYNFTSAKDNLIGLANRSKFRLRWYETKEGTSKVQIELKYKQNEFSYKETILIPKKIEEINLMEIFNTKSLLSLNISNFFLELSISKILRPVLKVSYKRNYMNASAISFNYDTNICYENLVISKKNLFKDCDNVLEVKTNNKKNEYIENYFKNTKMLFRQTRNSKYLKGLAVSGKAVYY